MFKRKTLLNKFIKIRFIKKIRPERLILSVFILLFLSSCQTTGNNRDYRSEPDRDIASTFQYSEPKADQSQVQIQVKTKLKTLPQKNTRVIPPKGMSLSAIYRQAVNILVSNKSREDLYRSVRIFNNLIKLVENDQYWLRRINRREYREDLTLLMTKLRKTSYKRALIYQDIIDRLLPDHTSQQCYYFPQPGFVSKDKLCIVVLNQKDYNLLLKRTKNFELIREYSLLAKAIVYSNFLKLKREAEKALSDLEEAVLNHSGEPGFISQAELLLGLNYLIGREMPYAEYRGTQFLFEAVNSENTDARQLLEKLAQHNHAIAQYYLAKLHVDKNEQEPLKFKNDVKWLFQQSALNGDLRALDMLHEDDWSDAKRVSKKRSESVKITIDQYRKAVKESLLSVYLDIFPLLFTGNKIAPDLPSAVAWWEQNLPVLSSQMKVDLGKFYEYGLSGQIDYGKAYYWYYLALKDYRKNSDYLNELSLLNDIRRVDPDGRLKAIIKNKLDRD